MISQLQLHASRIIGKKVRNHMQLVSLVHCRPILRRWMSGGTVSQGDPAITWATLDLRMLIGVGGVMTTAFGLWVDLKVDHLEDIVDIQLVAVNKRLDRLEGKLDLILRRRRKVAHM